MKNFANNLGNSFLSYEEDYNADFRYENDDENTTVPIEENDSIDDYNFYPDSGF